MKAKFNNRSKRAEDMPSDFERVVATVPHDMNVLSGTVRREENPPSASFHVLLDGKEYILSLQPTDMAPVEEVT